MEIPGRFPESKTPIFRQMGRTDSAGCRPGPVATGEPICPPGWPLIPQKQSCHDHSQAAYDWLEQQVLLEKVQGRGTFVRHH